MNPRYLYLVMLGVFLAFVAYIVKRVVFDLTDNLALRILGVIGIGGLTILGPILRVTIRKSNPPYLLSFFTLVWMGLTIYVLFGLVVGDALRGVVALFGGAADPERRRFLGRATSYGALAFSGGAMLLGTRSAFRDALIKEVPIRLPGLPKQLDGFTIVQLSDIHIGPLIRERFVDRLVSQSNALRGDLVVITGDLVDGTPQQLGHIVARLDKIVAPRGRYFVSGNHEYYSGWEPWVEPITKVGFEVLRNRRVAVGDGTHSFDLIGVDDWSQRGRVGGFDLTAAVAGRDKSRASILLSHQPASLDLAAAEGIGLQLSGHTHGGQFFPSSIFAKLIWGQRVAGHSTLGETQLYTSRGCGFVGPPSRLGVPTEIIKLTLLSA